jgi:hypothetical protein
MPSEPIPPHVLHHLRFWIERIRARVEELRSQRTAQGPAPNSQPAPDPNKTP